MSSANIGPSLFHHIRAVSSQMSIPRANSRSSTFRSDNGNRTYIKVTSRIIHPAAMPVILHDDEYQRWLTAPWDTIKEMVAPYPSQLMRVSQRQLVGASSRAHRAEHNKFIAGGLAPLRLAKMMPLSTRRLSTLGLP